MAGFLRTEVGTLALGFGESLGEMEVLNQWGTACIPCYNPDILDMGRMKRENWSLVLSRSSPNVGARSSDGVPSLGLPLVSSLDARGAREEGACQGLAYP